MTAYTFNQLFDFTRTTSATYVGSNGLIQTTPASVNLLTYTQEFDNAVWGKSEVTVTANATTAPDGTSTADKLVESTANSLHTLIRNITTTAVPYTWSCYIKAGERTFAFLYHLETNSGVSINLLTGATGTPSGTVAPTAATVTNAGNGWYRLTMTATATAATNSFRIYTATSLTGSAVYTGDGTSGIFIWGAQLEANTAATTYTRNNGGVYPARFDYDPVTLAPKGILIEEQRTNLFTYSNDFADASWVVLGAKNLVANSTVSPDGGTNASTLTDNSAVAFQGINKTLSVANDTASYTASIYVRKTTGGTSATFGFNLQLSGGTLVAASPRLNTDTGVLISGTATVQNAGAYWRLSATVTNNTTGNTTLSLAVYPATAPHGVATDSSAAIGSAIIYGTQMEAGTFATSYIPTVASQVTRSADQTSIVAPMFAPWYNQTEGTFVVSLTMLALNTVTTQEALQVDDGSSNNTTFLRGNNTAGSTSSSATTGGVAQGFIDIGGASAGVIQNIALAIKLNDAAMVRNGGAVSTDTTYSVPTGQTRAFIGTRNTGFASINGHIRSIRYFPFRASNNQLQVLTT